MNLSIRREALKSIHSVGSKSFTSHAKWTGKSLWSNWVISPAPDTPSSNADHVDSTFRPSGVTIPTRSPPPSAVRSSPSHPQPAVDQQHFARHERSLVRAEKRTAAATSSGAPSLPSGVAASMASVAPSGSTSVSRVVT